MNLGDISNKILRELCLEFLLLIGGLDADKNKKGLEAFLIIVITSQLWVTDCCERKLDFCLGSF